MTFTTLSAYLDDFLAMKRVRGEVDARSGPDRRQLRYTERLLRGFLEFWQARGCPHPIRAAFALDWVAIGTQAHHPYRDQHRVWAVRAFLTQVRAFESATEIPQTFFVWAVVVADPIYFPTRSSVGSCRRRINCACSTRSVPSRSSR